MPTRAFYTGGELEESVLALEIAAALEDEGGIDDDHEELIDIIIMFAAEPLQRRLAQLVGPERLSLERLRREAAV